MRTQELLDILDSGRFGIISAPEDKFGALLQEILSLVQGCNHIGTPVIVEGRYDGVNETSVLVPYLTDTSTSLYGRWYKQESVLDGHRGLIYTDESGRDDVARVKAEDVIEVLDRGTVDTQERLRNFDNASVAHLYDGVVVFSLGLDF